MRKSQASSSVDCLYMESVLNRQMRANIRMINTRIVKPPLTAKPNSQNSHRKIVKPAKEKQQFVIQLLENKIHMSQIYQPMTIHTHRVTQPSKNCSIESPKFKRNCFHFDNSHSAIKHQHFLKKGGQTVQQSSENKPWHPFIRMKKKKLLQQQTLDQKITQNTQTIQANTCFQSIADLSGWQINEEPQMDVQ